MKRWLYLVHRWLGVALCLLMAMWFASGIVMMYVGYPKLGDAERLARLPPLDAHRCCVGPAQALAQARLPAGAVERLRLTTIAGRPHWVVEAGRGGVAAVDAVDGHLVRGTGPTQAVDAAAAFSGRAADYLDQVDEDAWTHSRALDAHRPLHRVQVRDDAGTLLYVSSRTGEVVRDATRAERWWNYAGAWIHWLYPLRGGALDSAWHDVVVWTALGACVLALAGSVVGTMRWRFGRPYASGARTPYRERWMRWHHVAGMVSGGFAATWIFSGLMSMNPWQVFGAAGARLDARAYRAAALADLAGLGGDAERALARFDRAGFAARELEWRWLGDAGYVVASDFVGRTMVARRSGEDEPLARIPDRELLRAGARLVPGANLARATRLDAHDLYYYPRAAHTMLGQQERRLPVLRLEFDDPAATWIHLDPATGRVLGRLDAGQRVKRWLFAMLHSWDWLPLLQRRPLWDALLLAASAGGLALSVSGVVIGWRRIRRALP